MRFVIVKKGALSTFRFLEQSCKGVPGLRVIWDRRRGADRRGCSGATADNRRVGDRRQPEPHSWTAADHVLAEARGESPVGASVEVTQERLSV
jgi:hypothetical protein